MAQTQAGNWSEMQARLDAVDKAYSNLPAPPQPNDEWSEKVNRLHRALEGLREQCVSLIEQEDLRAGGES